MARRLQKGKNRLLLGVAGGLAEYSNVDPVIIRAAFILLAFAGGTGIVFYLLLALLMPRPETVTSQPLDVVRENIKTAPGEATETGRRAVQPPRGKPGKKGAEGQGSGRDGGEARGSA